MNRRGFFGMLGKLCAVGTAMAVAPALLAPVQKKVAQELGAIYFDRDFYIWTKDGWLKVEFGKPEFALAS